MTKSGLGRSDNVDRTREVTLAGKRYLCLTGHFRPHGRDDRLGYLLLSSEETALLALGLSRRLQHVFDSRLDGALRSGELPSGQGVVQFSLERNGLHRRVTCPWLRPQLAEISRR